MKIAQIAPLFESVPPKKAGGTERIVSYLTEALVRLGHEVTLFASGDSQTKADLIAACPQSLKSDNRSQDQIAHHVLLAETVFKQADDFDVIHNNAEYFLFPLARRHQTPTVTTMHWSLDYMRHDWEPLYKEYANLPFVPISDDQRDSFPWLNWQATVYHGLPESLYTLNAEPGKYLAFLGRLSPEKGVRMAIEIAVRAGMPLKVGGNVHNQEYFQHLRPLFKHPLIEYVGEVSQDRKNEFLGDAYAFLFPIDWREAFGLVMTEAMACGTPVIARDRGSVGEVITDGVTGFIFNTADEAVKSLEKIPSLNRQRCRQVFEQRFTDLQMAKGYLSIYEQLCIQKTMAMR